MSRQTARDNELVVKQNKASAGKEFQSKKITATGTSFAFNFVSQGLDPMESTDYVVMLQGETAAEAQVDESTITPDGFTIIGVANTEVVHVLVHGKLRYRTV